VNGAEEKIRATWIHRIVAMIMIMIASENDKTDQGDDSPVIFLASRHNDPETTISGVWSHWRVELVLVFWPRCIWPPYINRQPTTISAPCSQSNTLVVPILSWINLNVIPITYLIMFAIISIGLSHPLSTHNRLLQKSQCMHYSGMLTPKWVICSSSIFFF